MPGHQLITLVVLVGAVALMLSDRIRADLVALLAIVVLDLTGVLTDSEALSGFSRPAVITILAIFILAEGVRRAGLPEHVSALLLRIAGKSETRLVIVVMMAGAFLSLFMNNIAAASVLLPAVAGAARKSGVSASRLLMPLAFSTILGGMATLLTTANIVVGGMLKEEGLNGFAPLEFLPFGIPIVIAGAAYMALWGRRLLPETTFSAGVGNHAQEESELVHVYSLSERLFRAKVPSGSRLARQPLSASTLRQDYGVSVVAVESNGKTSLSPSPDTIINVGDVLVLEGAIDDFRLRDIEPYLEILPPREWRDRDLKSSSIIFVEAMIPPRSALIRSTLRSAHFRERFGMNVLVIGRAGQQISADFADLPLQFGDALLLQGPRERISVLRDEPDLILLAYEDRAPLISGKAKLAVGIMLLALALAVVKPAMVTEIILAGAVMMLLFGILSMDEAYRAIEWKSIFLIAGMLPIGLAMTETGLAASIANKLIAALGGAGPIVLLAGLIVLTVVLTQAMTGAVVATVIAPIAIHAARYSGANPRAFAMGVALASSIAFLTPMAHPVNILVMGQAGYRFRDYTKVGFPLTVVTLALVILLVPLLWMRH